MKQFTIGSSLITPARPLGGAMPSEWVWVLIPLAVIAGAFATAIAATMSRARVRELEIRERIAMIEKGLMPPPEVDPRGFDRAMDRFDRMQWTSSAARHRSAGIVLIGVGIGLFFMIAIAGEETNAGIGVGGFIAVMGLAFLINSLFERHNPSSVPPTNSSPRGGSTISGGPSATP